MRSTGRVDSFRYALRGLKTLFLAEPNVRIEAAATAIVVLVGVALGISWGDWCWIIVAITLVWTSEAFNTAVEFLGDVVTEKPHPLVGKAKDVAAAGVLVAAMGAGVIGVIILWPHIVDYLEG